MVASIQAIGNAVQLENNSVELKKEKATITFQEWWSGEKSLTSTVARNIDFDGFADWLEDKDKVCTDGQDDGKIGFKEGAKSFFRGLIGGIPKAMVKHPLITLATIAGGAGLMFLTGGAIAPILWGIGAAGVAAGATVNIAKASTAKTDGEKKAALEGLGTTTTATAMLGITYGTTMKAAAKVGVKTDGGMVQTLKSSAEMSAKSVKGNYLTWKTGVMHAHSNNLQSAHDFKVVPEGTKVQTLSEGVQTVQRGQVVAFDADGNPYITSVSDIVKNNTGLSVEAQKELLTLQDIKLKRTMFHGNRSDSYKCLEADINGEPHYKVFSWEDRNNGVYSTIDTEEGAQRWLLINWNNGKLNKGELPSCYGKTGAEFYRETTY